MKLIDEFYFGKYSYFKRMYGHTFAVFFAAIMLLTEIAFALMPIGLLILFIINDFACNCVTKYIELILGLTVALLFLYCWYYFTYKKNARRIIEKYKDTDELQKKKLRRKAGKLTVLCFVFCILQSVILLPIYVHWSFEKRGIKSGNKYEKLYENYKDNKSR